MAKEVCIRGIGCLPETTKVTFVEAVPPSFLCSLCNNLSSQLLKDSGGHTYCLFCMKMLNDDGIFTCVEDETEEEVAKLESMEDAWQQAQRLVVKCPKYKMGCKFQASLKDLQLHYPTCQRDKDMVVCSFCKDQFDSKEIGSHMKDYCPERPLDCPFCKNSFKERLLDDHTATCEQRPETCEFCSTPFDTYAELRDVHLDVCEKKPTDCPFKSFGCGFEGLRAEIAIHLQDSLDIHNATLVKALVSVTQDVKVIKKEVLQLQAQLAAAEKKKAEKGEVQLLRNRIGNVENAQSEALQHQLTMEQNMEDVSSRVKTAERTMANIAKDAASGVAERLTQIEAHLNVFSEPMNELLKNVAKV